MNALHHDTLRQIEALEENVALVIRSIKVILQASQETIVTGPSHVALKPAIVVGLGVQPELAQRGTEVLASYTGLNHARVKPGVVVL